MARIYADYARFLWSSLFRMGVEEAELPDAVQEVILVVHRRLGDFDGSSKLSTWLFGICLRVASGMRRTQRRRREASLEPAHLGSHLVDEDHPESLLARRDTQHLLARALDSLDTEKRALIVLFELEQMPCANIAELFGVPLGTVHSRLHNARKLFKQAVLRVLAQDKDRGAAFGLESNEPAERKPRTIRGDRP